MNLISLTRPKEVRIAGNCPSFASLKGGLFLINLNGEPTANFVGKTLTELLQQKTDTTQNVVVELNGAIIHRDELDTMTLSENDHVELISFVGGG
jgi:sulfur carrier protein